MISEDVRGSNTVGFIPRWRKQNHDAVWYAPEELARHFSQAVVPRTTNRHGCVTLHSYHFSIEEGLPRTQVLLWVSGEHLRAIFENVVLAEYRRRYD